MNIPFEEITERLRNIELMLHDLKNNPVAIQSESDQDQYLRSIKEISAFIGCCDVKSQKIKNNHPEIFVQSGRKFMVKKVDLLETLKKIGGLRHGRK